MKNNQPTKTTDRNPVSATDEPDVPQSAIAERAHQIYEREGYPEGLHLEHWLQAEREIADGDASDSELAD